MKERFCKVCGPGRAGDYCKKKGSDYQAEKPRAGCPYWEFRDGFIQRKSKA